MFVMLSLGSRCDPLAARDVRRSAAFDSEPAFDLRNGWGWGWGEHEKLMCRGRVETDVWCNTRPNGVGGGRLAWRGLPSLTWKEYGRVSLHWT